MSDQYRIFGAELSPYSVKVRSYFRYKGLAHEWIVRNVHNQAEFDRYAKLPLIPLVIAPDGTAMQDSTPIIERMLEPARNVRAAHSFRNSSSGSASPVSTWRESPSSVSRW